MILNISGRTDIVAFYTPWLLKRFEEGYVCTRNPFYKSLVNEIYFENVDGIVFCTKNPIPILNHLNKIPVPYIFHITLTSYKKDIEPNVPLKGKIINAIKELSKKIGKDKIWVRYDPVFINDIYTIDYHVKNFNRMCELLDGYVEKIIISFIDMYQNVRYNMPYLRCKNLSYDDYKKIGMSFSASAKKHGMTVQTCAEKNNLVEYGFKKSDCITKEVAFKLTGKTNFKKWAARKNKCSCVQTVDIGEYNTCMHLCKYCYANFDEVKVKDNIKKHDVNSSILIGEIRKEDIVKERLK